MATREENRARRRGQALEAARDLIAQGGVEAISMRRLASASGLAVNTLYALFDNRDGVLKAIIGDGIQRVAVRVANLDAREPLRAAEQFVRLTVSRIREESDYLRPMYQALSAFGPMAEVGRGRAGAVLLGLLERARHDGLIRDDVALEPLVGHTMQSFLGAAQKWAAGGCTLEATEAEGLFALWVAIAAVAADEYREEAVRRLINAQTGLEAANAE